MAPTTVISWKSTFLGHTSQDTLMDKFKNLLNNCAGGGSKAQRIIDACADPSIAFLGASPNHQILILHHFHHDRGTALNRLSDEIWALWGSDSHAIPMLIPSVTINKVPNSPTITAPSWTDFLTFSNVDEIKAFSIPKTPPTHANHLFRLHACLLPIPAFVTRALMNARTQDPFLLCLVAKDAIVAHANAMASQAGTTQDAALNDAVLSDLGSNLSFILQFLWYTADCSTKAPDLDHNLFVVDINPALSEPASTWSALLHSTVMARPFPAPNFPTPLNANPTNTNTDANYLAAGIHNMAAAIDKINQSRTADAAAVKAAATPKGFASFPTHTRRMILHASDHNTDGSARSKPLDSYAEVILLPNASYVRDHLHNILRNAPLNRDVHLSTAFCAAMKTGSIQSALNDQLGMFSLFSCYRQPDAHHDDTNEQEALRMQLKLQDSSQGLDDKDIRQLTKSYHVAPRDFAELSVLLENFAGPLSLMLGFSSRPCIALRDWVSFLRRGNLHPTLRSIIASDYLAAAKVGWHIERKFQQFLVNCAIAESHEQISQSTLQFDRLKQDLEDERALNLPLCPALQSRLRPTTNLTPPVQSLRGGGPSNSPSNVSNSNCIKLLPSDNWKTFVKNMDSCPIPAMCLKYHFNGKCTTDCHRHASHTEITDLQLQKDLQKWLAEVRTQTPPITSKKRQRPSTTDAKK